MIIDKIDSRPCWGKGAEIILHTQDREAVQALMEEYVEGKEYVAKIERKRQKRSLDANAYCWVLCRKIAEKIGSTDREVYKEAVKDWGLTTIRPEREDLVDDLVRMWDGMGIGNAHDILGKSKLEGYVNVKYYYGSSQYNTKQMARLIDGIVQEAKEQEIETMTPAELEKMKVDWAAKYTEESGGD